MQRSNGQHPYQFPNNGHSTGCDQSTPSAAVSRVAAVSLETALSRALESVLPRFAESIAAVVRQPEGETDGAGAGETGVWVPSSGGVGARSGIPEG